jgi:phage repressor protein C with HTH and peptisase S24 domain
MESKKLTPLQIKVEQAIAASGKSRNALDMLIQARTGSSGKVLFDIGRGKAKSPSGATLRHIADVLNVSVGYLTGETDNPNLEPDQPRTVGASDGDGGVPIKVVDLSYSMGDGINIEDYPEETTQLFDSNFLRSISRAASDRLIVVRGDGDSMSPTLVNQDMILVDTSQKIVNQQDRIWACGMYGAGMIKRLRMVGEGRVEIVSDNHLIDNRTVDADDLVIVGRVIWVGRRF